MADKDVCIANKAGDKVEGNLAISDNSASLSRECWDNDAKSGLASSKSTDTLGPVTLFDSSSNAPGSLSDGQKQNVAPESWQYDNTGHLLRAGDRVSASYDSKGQLVKATIDNESFERAGNDVKQTHVGTDGKTSESVIHDVKDFRLDSAAVAGKYAAVNVELKTANGDDTKFGMPIWESQSVIAQREQFAKNEADRMSQNPNPETWDYNEKGQLLSAGQNVKAHYDKNGELDRATIDGHTYERHGSDVVESYNGIDGKLRTHTDHGVSKFTLSTEDGDEHGKFKSVNLEASSEAGDSSKISKVVWESPEHKDYQIMHGLRSERPVW